MSRTSRLMSCTPQDVFDVLSDGWTYATWVVGAARIRSVDDGYPAPGKRIHHSVGMWPVLVNDETRAEECEAPHVLQLRVKAWPAGEGQVRIVCEPKGDGTEVTIFEQAVSGPATLIPRPAEDLMLHLRNKETLRRLAYLAESGARSEEPAAE
jgi:hypothetical protein